MNIQSELDEIIHCVTSKYKPEIILLFGSRANGTNKPDSDIDLCVIYDRLPKRKLEILQELYQALFTVQGCHAVDLLVFQADSYRERARQINTIEHAIQNEGRVVYEQS